jgi:hypothetical protein
MKDMLTKAEAEQLVVGILKSRFENQRISIADSRTVERAFGWVFFLEMDEVFQQTDLESRSPGSDRQQVFRTNPGKPRSPEQFIKLTRSF